MKCTNCGALVQEGCNFCESCGASLKEQPRIRAKGRICPDCGIEIPEGNKFCGNCFKFVADATESGAASASIAEPLTSAKQEPSPPMPEAPLTSPCIVKRTPVRTGGTPAPEIADGQSEEPTRKEQVPPTDKPKKPMPLPVILMTSAAAGVLAFGIMWFLGTGGGLSVPPVASEPIESFASSAVSVAAEPESVLSEEAFAQVSSSLEQAVEDNFEEAETYEYKAVPAITPIWDEADVFSEEGVARVRLGQMWGAIDAGGNYLLHPRYDQLGYFSEGRAVAVLGGHCGFVTDQGVELTPFEYDNAFSFSDGMAVVVKGGKYGFVDIAGREIIPLVLDGARQFSEGFAPVKKDDTWFYIEQESYEPRFAVEADEAYSFSDGVARFCVDGQWGYLDQTGNIIIPPQYELAEPFNEYGTAVVGRDGRQILIDAQGNAVSDEWEKIWNYSDGMATVLSGGRYGYLNKLGDVALPPVYRDVYSFAEGFCPIQMDSGRWGYIDREGNEVLPDIWTEAFKFVNGYARVEKDGRFGLIDPQGREIIPARMENTGLFGYGLIPVQENGRWGYYKLPE